jgi:hypothetical protein
LEKALAAWNTASNIRRSCASSGVAPARTAISIAAIPASATWLSVYGRRRILTTAMPPATMPNSAPPTVSTSTVAGPSSPRSSRSSTPTVLWNPVQVAAFTAMNTERAAPSSCPRVVTPP